MLPTGRVDLGSGLQAARSGGSGVPRRPISARPGWPRSRSRAMHDRVFAVFGRDHELVAGVAADRPLSASTARYVRPQRSKMRQ